MSECSCDDIIIEVNEEGIDGVGIASIELVSTVGITKNYRINLTNGTHFDYSISDGSSIASISKTSSAGLVDTYTVLLTNGDTSTFEVTNGNGIASIVKTSTDNLTDTYTISYTNGTTSTFTVTNGNSIASVSKVSTQVLTDTYQITYTDEDKSPDTFTVVNGRGITSIAKTSTSGLVDTYTVTYNDSSTSTFTVTNGMPATHSWNGTILTITSASGTSSADLKGEKGDAATIAVGTVTTSAAGTSATITNSGNVHDAVFDFTIPRGNTGNGIASITLQSTSDLIKTYRVTYTDGEHYDFNVADGNGIASITLLSESGATKTYRILFTDGTHFDYDVVDGSDEWGAIVGNLSDQTDLQNALDSKAPAITETASGSIASFTDGSTLPVESLTVGIEPVQDLHGYDSPWPAGGGVNIMPAPVAYDQTTNGVHIVSDGNGKITINGTATASFGAFINLSKTFVLPATSYLHCNNDVISADMNFILYAGSTQVKNISPLSKNYITSAIGYEGSTCTRIQLYILNGRTINMTFHPSVEATNSATDWTPYSNLCPISGHTSATVTRTRKNLLPDDGVYPTTKNGITVIKNADGSLSLSGTKTTSDVIFTVHNFTDNLQKYQGKYLHSQLNNYVGIVATYYDENNRWLSVQLTKGVQLDIPQNAKRMQIAVRVATSSDVTGSTLYPMISDYPDDTFEPYQGQSLTIDLDGTRYGGVLDVLTGEMTVTHGYYTVSDLEWSYDSQYSRLRSESITDMKAVSARALKILSSAYKTVIGGSVQNVPDMSCYNGGINLGDRRICVHDSRYTDADSFVSNMGTTQFVYELNSPLTVQLTPSQMQTLLGYNAVWADTGDTSVEYRADTKLFIQEQIAESETLTRKMIADIANGDLAPKTLAVDELVIVGDELRKATESIGQGSAITSLNSTTANLADVIKALQ